MGNELETKNFSIHTISESAFQRIEVAIDTQFSAMEQYCMYIDFSGNPVAGYLRVLVNLSNVYL